MNLLPMNDIKDYIIKRKEELQTEWDKWDNDPNSTSLIGELEARNAMYDIEVRLNELTKLENELV